MHHGMASWYATFVGRYDSLTHLLLVTTHCFPPASNTGPAIASDQSTASQPNTSATARPTGPGYKPTRPEAHCQLVLLVCTASAQGTLLVCPGVLISPAALNLGACMHPLHLSMLDNHHAPYAYAMMTCIHLGMAGQNSCAYLSTATASVMVSSACHSDD